MKSSARSDYPHQKDSIDPHSSPACWWWCSRCECAISSQSLQLMSFFFRFFFSSLYNKPIDFLPPREHWPWTYQSRLEEGSGTGKKSLPFVSEMFWKSPTLLQGCRMFTSVKAFEGQHYSTQKRQCLQSGLLFEDPRFPAIDDSLFYQGNRIGRVVWKRPRVSCPAQFLQIKCDRRVLISTKYSLQRTDLTRK